MMVVGQTGFIRTNFQLKSKFYTSGRTYSIWPCLAVQVMTEGQHQPKAGKKKTARKAFITDSPKKCLIAGRLPDLYNFTQIVSEEIP